MIKIKTLIGHSGCNIELIKKGNVTFVRKTSSEKKYNERLKNQFLKQKKFKSKFVFAPKVFDSGYRNGLFYFEMEFINGKSFNNIISDLDLKQIKFYFDIILDFIGENIDKSKIKNFEKEIKNKLSSLEINYNIPNIIISDQALNFQLGYCHGDLTFENIIVKNKKIYLIDFLDSYINSPLIDISKLQQDLILNWSNRFKNEKILCLIRNQWLYNYLDLFIEDKRLSTEAIELQKKLTLLRILP